MRSLDLFSGVGGLTKGLEAAGINALAAFESDPSIRKSFRANFPEVEMVSGDVRDVDFSDWRGGVDIIVGGPPCQPFSVAGRQLSSLDPRDCVPEFIRAVAQSEPRAFLMENVSGLAALRHRNYLSAVMESLGSLGYEVRASVLDAADYGVPQFRKRLFIVGAKETSFLFPAATHGENRRIPRATSADALRDTPEDIPNTARITYAKKPILRPQPWDGMLVNGGGRPINPEEPSQTIPASAGGNRTHILDPDGILAKYHTHLMNGGRPREGDVPGVRRLTVRESARLQSFPDGHAFVGPQSSRYRQVGNAVPPLLAEALAKSLMKQLSGEKEMSPDTSAAWQSTLPLSF